MKVFAPVATGGFLIGLWYLAIHSGWVKPFLLPPPHTILLSIWENRLPMFQAGLETFYAATLGFLAAVFGGFTIAMLLSSNRWVKASFHPYVLIIQMTPIIIITPIIGMWMDEALLRIVTITFLISFFPVAANTTLGLISIDKNLIDLFQVYGASRKQEILLLRIPFALPNFLTGVKIAGTLAPIGAITGDFLLGTSRHPGLGYLVLTYRNSGQIPEMFGIAVVACLLGFLFVALVNAMHRLFLRSWHESALPGD